MTGGAKIKHSFPDVLRIEASGKCNFRCTHCPNGYAQGKREVMPNDIFMEIQRQIERKAFIPRVVVLYHGGEPLLNQNIAEHVRWFKSKGTQKIKIVTNGSLLTEHIATELDRNGLDELWISFDGDSPEENDAIRKGGNFQRDSKNVKRALNIKKRRMKIVITNVQVFSKEDIDKYIDGCLNINIPKYITQAFSNYENISYQAYPAMAWPSLTCYANGVSRYSPPTSGNKKYCSNLFETFSILSNGDVVPCCHDIIGEAILGNILNDSMFEIWNGPRHVAFRNALLDGRPEPICSKCIILKNEYLIKNDQPTL